jgi:hypothetical protein
MAKKEREEREARDIKPKQKHLAINPVCDTKQNLFAPSSE